jgi:hypothetical protein
LNTASSAVGLASQAKDIHDTASSLHSSYKASKGGKGKKREVELDMEDLVARDYIDEWVLLFLDHNSGVAHSCVNRIEELVAREPEPAENLLDYVKREEAFELSERDVEDLTAREGEVEELAVREPSPSFKSFLGKIGGFAKGLIGLRRDVDSAEIEGLAAREPSPSFKSFLGKIGGFAKGLIGLRRDVGAADFDNLE